MQRALKEVEVLKFIVVGIINSLCGFIIIYLMFQVLKFSYFMATISGYGIGIMISIFLNNYYTFKKDKIAFVIILKALLIIAVSYSTSYYISHLFLKSRHFFYLDSVSMLKITFNFHLLLAIMINAITYSVLYYAGNKLYIYKSKKIIAINSSD